MPQDAAEASVTHAGQFQLSVGTPALAAMRGRPGPACQLVCHLLLCTPGVISILRRHGEVARNVILEIAEGRCRSLDFNTKPNVRKGSKLAPPEEVDDRQEGHPHRPTPAIAAIVLVMLIIGHPRMHASTQRQPAQHPSTAARSRRPNVDPHGEVTFR
jgi:hypothetical protein